VMTLGEVVKALDLKVLVGKEFLGRAVSGAYASDVLSDVLAHSDKGNVWVTVQIHPNVSAVATAKDLAAVIIANGRSPETDTLKKAEQKKLPILSSPLSTYKVAGKLYELGIG